MTGKEAKTEYVFEKFCRIDDLGLQDSPCDDQSVVHSVFLEQIERCPERWYETPLPRRENFPPLPSKKQKSLRQLKTPHEYDPIIQDQL